MEFIRCRGRVAVYGKGEEGGILVVIEPGPFNTDTVYIGRGTLRVEEGDGVLRIFGEKLEFEYNGRIFKVRWFEEGGGESNRKVEGVGRE